MPILMMALLALMVFGLIGILLTSAMILEHSQHAYAAKRGATHSAATAMTSGVASSLKPKHP